MTRRIEFNQDGIHMYRYEGSGPYAILICHGGGGWGGMYDDFCYPYAKLTNADIWCWDHPGFGQSGKRGVFTIDDWIAGLRTVIREIRAHNRKPLFVLGSSLGGILASIAVYEPEVHAVAIQASVVAVTTPGYEGAKKMLNSPGMKAFLDSPWGETAMLSMDGLVKWETEYGDPVKGLEIKNNVLHTDMMMLRSWASIFSYDQAPFPLSENKKPFLFMYGERDPILLRFAGPNSTKADVEKSIIGGVGGPKELIALNSDKHQLMLFETQEFCEKLGDWCQRVLPKSS